RGPPGEARFLRLLEVVADAAGADAEQSNLPAVFRRGRSAALGQELSLERLGERDGQALLGVAPELNRLAREGDRPREFLGHVGGRLVAPGDDRRKAVADPCQGTDAWIEPE